MDDRHYMAMALELAREAAAQASPNPRVGAVVVRPDGGIVGRGVHRYADRRHAEITALSEAGGHAAGATLYVNLEPCCHHGRTPPCTDAIIAAGIRRVVAAMRDPNPHVDGGGMERLRAAGIAVTAGVREDEARALNRDFAKWIRTRLPYVTLKSAASLDGRIAAAAALRHQPSASTTWISCAASRARVQQIRHEHDAILTGIGTVLADNPRLTDRSGRPRRRPLLRVVVDSDLRLPLDSVLVRSAQSDLAVFCRRADPARRAALEAAGACVIEVNAAGEGGVGLDAVLRRLGADEITSVLLEGGARLNAAMLAAGHVDRLLLFLAPVLLGEDATPLLRGLPHPLHLPGPVSAEIIDRDVLLETELRDPYLPVE